ncbi:MAG: transporter [Marinisporobacter sp.]|jgi:predicted permease|nr:transporter [Marinisporobacter sp.]
MNIVLKIAYFISDLILPLCVGYLLSKKAKANKEFFDKLLYVNIYLFFPTMGLLSFWNATLSLELIWLPFLGIIMQVIPGVIAAFRVKKKYEDPLEQGSYLVSTMLSNRGVVGSLSVFILYGEIAYAYSRFIMMLGSITVYMFCYPLAQHFYQKKIGKQKKKSSLKSALFNKNQFPLIGLLLGVILNTSGIERPMVFGTLFQVIVHISAWISLIPVGYSINFEKMKKYKREMWELSSIKFIITPLLTFILARWLISDPIVLNTTIILAFSPTAINAVITAKINKLNIHLAMASFITTTIIYLLFIFPIILLLFNI